MKRERLTSTILTVIVIGLLLFSGPTNAVLVTIDGDSSKNFSPAASLAAASLNATINIQSAERINIQNYTIRISNASGANHVNCSVQLNGTELTGCGYITNVQISYTNSNYTYGDLYGYGYTTAGSNQIYGQTAGYGYGYGDAAGITNEIIITFDWEFQKQLKPAGTYSLNVGAVAKNGDEIKTFTSDSTKSIILNAVSTHETAGAAELSSSISTAIGGGTVTVPANVGFIDTANFSTNVSSYLKGIIGVTGNITINVSLGSGIGGISSSNLPEDTDDTVLNIYLDINGTIDSTQGYADIYLSIPKELVDALGSSAKDNLKSYVLHNDGTESAYNLIRVSDLDTSSDYAFRIRTTKFSIFGLYHHAASSSSMSPSTGGSSSGGLMCGDGYCQSFESCSVCPEDCGVCPVEETADDKDIEEIPSEQPYNQSQEKQKLPQAEQGSQQSPSGSNSLISTVPLGLGALTIAAAGIFALVLLLIIRKHAGIRSEKTKKRRPGNKGRLKK